MPPEVAAAEVAVVVSTSSTSPEMRMSNTAATVATPEVAVEVTAVVTVEVTSTADPSVVAEVADLPTPKSNLIWESATVKRVVRTLRKRVTVRITTTNPSPTLSPAMADKARASREPLVLSSCVSPTTSQRITV